MTQQGAFDFHETPHDAAIAAIEDTAFKLGQVAMLEIARAYWSPDRVFCFECGGFRVQVEHEREVLCYPITCCDGTCE